MPSTLFSSNIIGDQTKDSSIDEVLFKTSDHISVYGELVIASGFTLMIEDVMYATEISTPLVSESEIATFCQGLNDKLLSFQRKNDARTVKRNPNNNLSRSNKFIDTDFPNPTNEKLTISTNRNPQIYSIDILSSLGTIVYSIANSDLSGRANFSIDTSMLECGPYTLCCIYLNGEKESKTFLFIR